MEVKELKEVCKKSLENCRLGKDDVAIQDGKDFYKFMFGNFPNLRIYFKGAERFTPEDVQNSDRFAKQGQRALLAVHMLANIIDDTATFKAYARETVNRHRVFKLEPSLWRAFFGVLVGYLKTKTSVDDKVEEAWVQLGDLFADECLAHLEDLGLPH